MLPDVVDQAILILAHLEKVVVLADTFDGSFAVRAEAILDIFLCPKSLIERAVPSSVIILVNQLLVVKFLKVSLNDRFVRCIRRSDESIVGNVQPFPKGLELRRQLVAMGLRVDAGFGRCLLNFLPMFIEPGEKEDVASTQAPVTSKDIGSHGRIGMSDVRHIVHVIDRCRDVEAVGGDSWCETKDTGNKRRKLGRLREQMTEPPRRAGGAKSFPAPCGD